MHLKNLACQKRTGSRSAQPTSMLAEPKPRPTDHVCGRRTQAHEDMVGWKKQFS